MVFRIATSLALICLPAGAAEVAPEQLEFFETRIRPILAQECYECHSSTGKQKGDLVLDSREGWEKGGESGEVIVRGKPEASLLLKSIRHVDPDLQMPKKNPKLDDRIIEDFRNWIAMGAPDPRDHPSSPEEIAHDRDWRAVLERRKGWWSLQPLRHVTPPVPEDPGWSSHPIDRFLRQAMEEKGLSPVPDAPAPTLLRRLSYVLTGMPPTPEETASFVAAAAQDPDAAVKAAADRLLASPRFGERWARHWMDWVRYADSHGSEGDAPIPFAWQYRDYLIRALNADVSYQQLVREQIAGDLLEQPRINRQLGINESAIGAAQYRFVLHGYSPTDSLDELVTFTDNQIDTLSKGFLGLTVACARCHNHKFDAVSQTDFYALFGVMASCRPATIDVNLPERQVLHCEELKAQKLQLRSVLAQSWLARLDAAVGNLRSWKPADEKQRESVLAEGTSAIATWLQLSTLPPERWPVEWEAIRKKNRDTAERLAKFRSQPAFIRWDMRGSDEKQWVADGAGVSDGPTAPGEFHVEREGNRVLSDIFPAGTYSHLLSDKHRGVLVSPPFMAEGGRLWVRVRGAGQARVRYVVQNYPRSGNVHLKQDLTTGAEQWVSWKLDYWKGDKLYLEVTTDDDQPVESHNLERSWFGISEVLYARELEGVAPPLPGAPLTALCAAEEPAPGNSEALAGIYRRVLKQCLEDWRDEKMSDAEAEFLGEFVRRDLLPNHLDQLPEVAGLIGEYRGLEHDVPVPTRAPGVLEGFAADQALYTRGDHKKPAEVVPRRFLEAIDPTPFLPGSTSSGRRALAESFVASRNPLASRVIVNRLWHHVFGRGIVPTPDNLGRLGEPPSHPNLLEYLADHFQRSDGSIKAMLRMLVTSRAFRLDAKESPEAQSRDPDDRLLSHFPVRRLEAESIRDSMLALTGKLEAGGNGPSVDGGKPRRSIYTKVMRNSLDPLLTAFDFPVPTSTRGRRDSTNVPAQALALMNDPLVLQWAAEWAQRTKSNGAVSDEDRVRAMFQQAFGRDPSSAEMEKAIAFVHAPIGPGDRPPWEALAAALFNSKEFIYLR